MERITKTQDEMDTNSVRFYFMIIGVLVLLFGAYLIFKFWYIKSEINEYADWELGEGKIEEFQVETIPRSNSNKKYILYLEYSYVLADDSGKRTRYRSRDVGLESSFFPPFLSLHSVYTTFECWAMECEKTQGEIRELKSKEGEELGVYYDPENFKDSIIFLDEWKEMGWWTWGYLWSFFGVILIVFSANPNNFKSDEDEKTEITNSQDQLK
jgi:hypothetical protein